MNGYEAQPASIVEWDAPIDHERKERHDLAAFRGDEREEGDDECPSTDRTAGRSARAAGTTSSRR